MTPQQESERDKRMLALAVKFGEAMNGENLFEAASVCARMLVFAVAQMPHPYAGKMNLLTELIKFMRQELKRVLHEQQQETAKH
jgi:hypothetical protein